MPSKNTGMHAAFAMLEEVFLPCQRHKNTLNNSVLAIGTHQKNSKNPPKSAQCPTWTFKKHLTILSSFFHTPEPEKHENTNRVKDFGVRRQGRTPVHMARRRRNVVKRAAASCLRPLERLGSQCQYKPDGAFGLRLQLPNVASCLLLFSCFLLLFLPSSSHFSLAASPLAASFVRASYSCSLCELPSRFCCFRPFLASCFLFLLFPFCFALASLRKSMPL